MKLTRVRLAAPPRRVLVICLRRIGDVLLSTSLVHSLRVAWPQARIEVLVTRGSRGVLEGNPDIDALVVQPDERGLGGQLRFAASLFRRYDLVVNTLYNDRGHLYALLAAGTRVGMVPPPGDPGARWKRWVSTAWSSLSPEDTHTMAQYLTLADCLGIARQPIVVPPQPADTRALDEALGAEWRERPYAVLHPSAMYRYKGWTLEGWRAVVAHFVACGLDVRITGGPADKERADARELVESLDPALRAHVVDLSGRFSLALLTPLIGHARVFIGPDTSVTHLAAATGRPTVALFGPTSPLAWGPWPQGHAGMAATPWCMKAPLQQVGNVWLVQGEGDCVPCLQEGCDRHVDSYARCLDELSPARVIDVLDQALGRKPRVIPVLAVQAPASSA